MPSCFLVHGHSYKGKNLHGKNTIDRLRPYVEKKGWTARDFDYKVNLISPHPLYWHYLGRKFAKMAQPGDMAIGASAGASAIYMAMRKGAPLNPVILINPVLRKDAVFPEGQLKVYVWHSSRDSTVKGASFARHMPLSPWGGMGLDGYVGSDKRVENIDAENDFKEEYGLSAPGHCEMLLSGKLSIWAPHIMKLVPDLTTPV